MQHDNVVRFVGMVVDAPENILLHVYCSKGSLQVVHQISIKHKKYPRDFNKYNL